MVFLKRGKITFSHPTYVFKILIDTFLLSLFAAFSSYLITESMIPSFIFTTLVMLMSFYNGWRRAPHLFNIMQLNEDGIIINKKIVKWAEIEAIATRNDSLTYRYNAIVDIEYPLGMMIEIRSDSRKTPFNVAATPLVTNYIGKYYKNTPRLQFDRLKSTSATENIKLSIWLPTVITILVNVIVGIINISYCKYSITASAFTMWLYRRLLEYYMYRYH